MASVLPIAHFGALTWWPGKVGNNVSKTISNRVGLHLKELDKVLNAAAQAILPVYRKTPFAVLLRESGLAPANLTLGSLLRNAAIRNRRLDPLHPKNQLLLKSGGVFQKGIAIEKVFSERHGSVDFNHDSDNTMEYLTVQGVNYTRDNKNMAEDHSALSEIIQTGIEENILSTSSNSSKKAKISQLV